MRTSNNFTVPVASNGKVASRALFAGGHGGFSMENV